MGNPTKKRSEGQRLLRDALKERGAQAELARFLDTYSSVVSRWADGRQSPHPVMRRPLESRLGIKQQLWDIAWGSSDAEVAA